MLSPAHQSFHDAIALRIPHERLITDPTRTLAYGTDASFYRLVPQIVVRVEHEHEIQWLLQAAHTHEVSLTFRAAGTSLSGQAVTDSVLVTLGDGWSGREVLDAGERIRLQPGVIGKHANDALLPYGRKIGPDPASIATARIGGMAANNSSGMCCGTRQNGYHTLHTMRIVLPDGAVLDTGDTASIRAFRQSHAAMLDGLSQLSAGIRARPELEAKIRHKYRLKNTTGYGINALVDFDDPVDMLAHLMIGSEGTLGFISSITYNTVVDHPHKASCLVLFHELDACCRAVTALRDGAPVAAVELIDARSIRTVQGRAGLPAFLYGDIPEGAAALLIETRAGSGDEVLAQCAQIEQLLDAFAPTSRSGFSSDAAVTALYWSVRSGLFPAVGAARPVGTTVVIEDVAFPIEHLADGVRKLNLLFAEHGYTEALLFGHALDGNLHFVFTPGFDTPEEVQRYSRFMDAVSHLVATEYGGSLKAEHGTGRNMAPFVRLEWGDDAFDVMRAIKLLVDPHGILNPDVIISNNERIHLENLKAMPAADGIVDRCIECGFCEPACPSNGLTLSPRQRIVLWRAISAARRKGDEPRLAHWERDFRYAGIDTCAGTNMCATRCPVSIPTGDLMKKLRGPTPHPGTYRWVARHIDSATGVARIGLASWSALRRVLGESRAQGINRSAHRLIPIVPLAPASTPRASAPLPVAESSGRPVVYFVSCVSRSLAEGSSGGESVAASTLRLFRKTGWRAIYPPAQSQLCCGQPFASQGADDAANESLARTNAALLQASSNGEIPVYLDNGPCAERLLAAHKAGQLDARLKLHDAASFLEQFVAPQLNIARRIDHLAVHVPCSATKMGVGPTLLKLAGRCAKQLTTPDIACCGFAGDKGFSVPELNANSLKRLHPAIDACSAGVSMSRTCQIGLTAHGGIEYHSIEALLDQLSEETVKA